MDIKIMGVKKDMRPPEYRYWKQLMEHLKGDTEVFFNGQVVYPRQFEIHLPGNHLCPVTCIVLIAPGNIFRKI